MSTPAGDLWIITSAEKVQEVAAWLDRSVSDPRYLVHETGCAIALGPLSEDDDMLFRMMYPELINRVLPHSLLEALWEKVTAPMLMRFASDFAEGRQLACEQTEDMVQVTSRCPNGGKPRIMTLLSRR